MTTQIECPEFLPYGKHLLIFPYLYNYPHQITEDEVEQIAERLMNRADQAFLAGKATQPQYDGWCAALDSWARRTLARAICDG